MKIKRRKIKRGRIEIIPMIDTIVILLIFYMSFARFAEMAKEAKIELPTSVAGKEIKTRLHQVIINMVSVDEITISKRPYTMKELQGVLLKMKQDDPEVQVVLRAGREAKYEALSDFMRACAKAGIIDVAFSTLEKR
jgi:biopolymer transport protein ExbD